jgi:DNA-binding NtrC family response regulator
MEVIVLIVSGDVDLAGRIQQALRGSSVPTYFAMNAERVTRALDELEANVVVVDRSFSDGAMEVLENLSMSHPHVARILLVDPSSGSPPSALDAELVSEVAAEADLPAIVQRVASRLVRAPREAADGRDGQP